jgi:hypothetical protein
MNRSFSQEVDPTTEAAPAEGGGEPEYTFEGFKVDFSDKVMLTPWERESKKDRKTEGRA